MTGSTLNQPVQELYNAGSFTGIDIITATNTTYKAFITPSKILSGTGNVFWELYGRLDPTAGTYPGCDTPNIKLPNGQVWAACNVGASVAYTGASITNCGWSATDCDTSLRYTLWSYFQWGRNDDVTAQGTPTSTLAPAGTTASTVGHSNFIMNGTTPFDWIAAQNNNLWGGAATTASSGAFTGMIASDQAAMKGPCASGYHVPTEFEWCNAIGSITNKAFACDNTWHNDTTITFALKLPLAGYRNYSTAGFVSQGIYGYYWSVTPGGAGAYDAGYSSTQVVPTNGNGRDYGFSLRCLKN